MNDGGFMFDIIYIRVTEEPLVVVRVVEEPICVIRGDVK